VSLKEEVDSLTRRIDILERRIDLLEHDNVKLKEKLNMEVAVLEKPKTVKRTTVKKPNDIPKPKIDLEKQIGQVWLPRIFIFVLLLGVIWAFKAATNNGIITEPVRILLGYLFSLVLYLFGERQVKHERKALGLVLLGGTVTLLVLTTFAAHYLYNFLPPAIAFLLNIVWVGLGLFLSYKHRSEPLSVFVAIGGYLVPFLIESTNSYVFVFGGYELILYLSLFLFAVNRGYIVLFYISLFLLHIVYFINNMYTNAVYDELLFLGILVQHLTLLLYFIWKSEKMQHLLISMFGNFVLTITWVYLVYDQAADWWSLGFFVLYTLLAVYLKGKGSIEKVAVAATIASFSLLVFLLSYFETDAKAGLIVIEGTLMIFLGLHLKASIKQVSGILVYIIGMGIILNQEIELFFSVRTLNWLLVIATIAAVHVLFKKYKKAYVEHLERIMLNGTAGALLFVILLFITQVTGVLTEEFSFNVTQMAISFVWAIYAVCAIIFGVIKKVKWIRLFGIGMLFVTLLKLIFIDLPTVSIVIRAILFIGIGVIGMAISRFYYMRKNE
jgi:uncharacterized membrane protein